MESFTPLPKRLKVLPTPVSFTPVLLYRASTPPLFPPIPQTEGAAGLPTPSVLGPSRATVRSLSTLSPMILRAWVNLLQALELVPMTPEQLVFGSPDVESPASATMAQQSHAAPRSHSAATRIHKNIPPS